MIAEPPAQPTRMQWTRATLAIAYEHFNIKDERSQCPCGRITERVFDGKCFTCHVRNFRACGRTPCPPLPVGGVA